MGGKCPDRPHSDYARSVEPSKAWLGKHRTQFNSRFDPIISLCNSSA